MYVSLPMVSFRVKVWVIYTFILRLKDDSTQIECNLFVLNYFRDFHENELCVKVFHHFSGVGSRNFEWECTIVIHAILCFLVNFEMHVEYFVMQSFFL